MSLRDQIAEAARQLQTGDDWYFAERPYALEMRVPPSEGATVVFVFPRGPTSYSVDRVMRQVVTPTVGGAIAEERGLLWREIAIEANFGLEPKKAYDTSGDTTGVPTGAALSGPMWTRRMVRNVFERYAQLKADPNTCAGTSLIWHDMKTDDHWLIVPERVSIRRVIASRGMYPVSISGKAIADAVGITLPIPESDIVAKAKNVVTEINTALTIVSSAIQETSAILGEVRAIASTIDDTIDKITTIINSAQAFVDGANAIAIGRMFVTSAAEALEAVIALLETSASAITSIPDDVRQTFIDALRGLEAMAAQTRAFGEPYNATTGSMTLYESGAARESQDALDAAQALGPSTTAEALSNRVVRYTDADLVDQDATQDLHTFSQWTNFASYTVRSIDTLQSIAMHVMGDAAQWYELALINGLSYPYISPTGAPGTVTVGDTIAIPVIAGPGSSVVANAEDPDAELYGVDIALRDSDDSSTSQPQVEIAIDRRTMRDCRVVSGADNLVQAIQLRLWTEQGRMISDAGYGLPRVVGYGNKDANLAALRVAVRATLLADVRVDSISRFSFQASGDAIVVDADVIPVGRDTARSVTAVLA